MSGLSRSQRLDRARPADPFIRFRLDPGAIESCVIDGDHVAFIRPGRRTNERWVTALGDDPRRVASLIDALADPSRPRGGIDGVHVHDHVYGQLRPDLQGPDPGHWSMWEFAVSAIQDAPTAARLDPSDARIDSLLRHSDSAYIYSADPHVHSWLGIEDGRDLVAVGAITAGRAGSAHLVSICTDPGQRRRGFGRAITAALVREALAAGASGVWLEMYAGNAAAAHAYRAVGFEEVARYRSALRSEACSPESTS